MARRRREQRTVTSPLTDVADGLALAEGGPGLAGLTGARAKEELGRRGLDSVGGLGLNHGMQTSRRASIDTQLTALAKRREALRGELAEQAEKIATRAERGKPATARMVARHEQMRAAYWSVKQRYELLQAKEPAKPVVGDDL